MQAAVAPAESVTVSSKRQPSRSRGKKKKDVVMEEGA